MNRLSNQQAIAVLTEYIQDQEQCYVLSYRDGYWSRQLKRQCCHTTVDEEVIGIPIDTDPLSLQEGEVLLRSILQISSQLTGLYTPISRIEVSDDPIEVIISNEELCITRIYSRSILCAWSEYCEAALTRWIPAKDGHCNIWHINDPEPLLLEALFLLSIDEEELYEYSLHAQLRLYRLADQYLVKNFPSLIDIITEYTDDIELSELFEALHDLCERLPPAIIDYLVKNYRDLASVVLSTTNPTTIVNLFLCALSHQPPVIVKSTYRDVRDRLPTNARTTLDRRFN